VIAIHRRGRRARLALPHQRYLGVREAIGFQIRQGPEGLAETRPTGARRVPVGVDRLLGFTRRFQRVANGKVQVRVLRRLFQQLAIERQGCLVVTNTGGRGGQQAR
jgi:hypothetical protein